MRLKSVHKKATTSMLYLDSLDKNTTGLLEVIFLGIKRLNHLLPAKNVNACNHFHKFYCVFNGKIFHSFDLWKPLNSEIIFFNYPEIIFFNYGVVLWSNKGMSTTCFTFATLNSIFKQNIVLIDLTTQPERIKQPCQIRQETKNTDASDFNIYFHRLSLLPTLSY